LWAKYTKIEQISREEQAIADQIANFPGELQPPIEELIRSVQSLAMSEMRTGLVKTRLPRTRSRRLFGFMHWLDLLPL
jgi:hypothetical protein